MSRVVLGPHSEDRPTAQPGAPAEAGRHRWGKDIPRFYDILPTPLILLMSRPRQCLHRHLNFELIIALDGPLELIFGDTSVQSSAFLIPPLRPHRTTKYEGRVAILYPKPGYQRSCYWKDAPIRSDLVGHESLIAELEALFETRSPEASALVSRWLEAWILPSDIAPPCDPRIKTVLEHLMAQNAINADRASMGRLVDLSPTRFAALFAENMGLTLSRYLIWRRVEIGLRAMKAGESVTAAALEAGFSDGAHFTRCCRATMGNMPSVLVSVEASRAAPVRPGTRRATTRAKFGDA